MNVYVFRQTCINIYMYVFTSKCVDTGMCVALDTYIHAYIDTNIYAFIQNVILVNVSFKQAIHK